MAVATFAGASSVVVAIAIYDWSMTERFGLNREWSGSLSISAIAVVWCAIGSLVLLAILVIGRLRQLPVWAAAGVGGLLFWLVPSALVQNLATGLMSLPAGVIAGVILCRARSDAAVLGRLGTVVFAGGFLLWSVLLAISAFETWNGATLPRQAIPKSLLGTRVIGGAAFGSELWLFNATGEAASYRLTDWHGTKRSSSGVAALATRGNTMVALIAPTMDWGDHRTAGQFRLASYDGRGWSSSPWQDYTVGERPIALTLGPNGPVILGPKKLYLGQPNTHSITVKSLNQTLEPRGRIIMALADNDTMYVGGNQGEWGGGLLRITLSTGEVTMIDERQGKELCSGPLNRDCDPVTGLVPDPRRPGCVFASIGLAHMSWHGRVVRVCGTRVETIFEAQVLPVGERILRAFSSRARSRPPQTEPIFGLAPAEDGFWAVTPRALYRWRQGAVDRIVFPRLEEAEGLAFSKAIPGLIVTTTDANAAASMSGVTPLVFATAR